MTKQELMETYTAEQLADKIIELEAIIDDKLGGWSKHGISYNDFFSMQDENKKLKSEVEKYRKAFEDAKKESDCQIAECQKKIEELTAENSELHCELQTIAAIPDEIPTEPIKVADMLINVTYTREKGDIEKAFYKAFGNNSDIVEENVFDISELRQIAEHLLVYCNHNGEVEEC